MLTIGVDLAQARDRTAIVAVESYRPERPAPWEEDVAEVIAATPMRELLRGRTRTPHRERGRHHEIRYMHRLHPGTTYPEQTSIIVQTADSLAMDERPQLVVDATGVGRPVVDMLREASPYPVKAVTIGSGSEVTKSGRLDVTVPKADLVGALEVVLSTRRLHAVPNLPLASELDKELRSFGYELSATGRPRYEGKGSHDDLVTALALAVWGAERGGNIGANFMEFMRRDMERRRSDPNNYGGLFGERAFNSQ